MLAVSRAAQEEARAVLWNSACQPSAAAMLSCSMVATIRVVMTEIETARHERPAYLQRAEHASGVFRQRVRHGHRAAAHGNELVGQAAQQAREALRAGVEGAERREQAHALQHLRQQPRDVLW